jgi:hypothetical protein
MPKISIASSDYDRLEISPFDLEALDIMKFEVSPWANNDDGTISVVDNLEEADSVGVYARLVDGTTAHIKDFNIDADAIDLDSAEKAQEDAATLAKSLNDLLDSEPVFDDHLEAAYEDRVSGMDFDWEQ